MAYTLVEISIQESLAILESLVVINEYERNAIICDRNDCVCYAIDVKAFESFWDICCLLKDPFLQ